MLVCLLTLGLPMVICKTEKYQRFFLKTIQVRLNCIVLKILFKIGYYEHNVFGFINL